MRRAEYPAKDKNERGGENMSTQTITIQRTSKKYKAAGCLGNLAIIVGGIWGVAVFMINKTAYHLK